MRFLFASDSFKGTLSSARTSELLAQAAGEAFPSSELVRLEVADGGEGTVRAVVATAGGRLIRTPVTGPVGRVVEAEWGLLPGGAAIIEMAAASGLPLVRPGERNPLLTGSQGTGELVVAALDAGATEITLAIGGSATNDGGMGCMTALGARFLDGDGRMLEGRGADLAKVCAIDLTELDERIADVRFKVMCDVNNPLLGPRGATAVFGPQKGATRSMLNLLEDGMATYADLLARTFEGFDPMAAGMGAAGGLGAACVTFLGAELVRGIDAVLDLVGFDELLGDCALVVTGEGHADGQSAHGKVISGIALRCRRAGVPCVAVVGGMDADACDLLEMGVDALVPTVIDAVGLEEALAHAERNYLMAARRLFALLRLGRDLTREARIFGGIAGS